MKNMMCPGQYLLWPQCETPYGISLIPCAFLNITFLISTLTSVLFSQIFLCLQKEKNDLHIDVFMKYGFKIRKE